MVVDEDVGSDKPLPVEFSPHGFAPPCVGYGEMQAAFVQVVPYGAGHNVPQGIGKVVDHHFGLSRCAAGKIEQRRVAVAIDIGRPLEWWRAFDAFAEIFESCRYERPDADDFLNGGTCGQGFCYVVGDGLFAGAYDGFDGCALAAVFDVFVCEQVCGGDAYCAQLVERQYGEPKFVTPFQNEHYHVSAPYSQRAEIGCGLV